MTTETPGGPGTAADGVAARRARGAEARRRVPLEVYAELPGRPADIDPVGLLEHQGRTRVPELVPLRYGRMLATPFAFYRGAALIMADDLGFGSHSGLTVQLCGDAHLGNFGLFASVDRRLVFDVNDFDESHPGPFEWDLKRWAASMEAAGRQNGLGRGTRRRTVEAMSRAYRKAMRGFAQRGEIDLWYVRLEMSDGLRNLRSVLSTTSLRQVERVVAKSRSRDRSRAAARSMGHCSPPMPTPCPRSVVTSCGATPSWMRPARSWGWAAWALGPGSSC